MANITNKIIENVINNLEKMKSPENKNSSFWSYLKDQLYSDSTWEPDDLAVIEKQIMTELNKLNPKELTKIWELSDAASKFDDISNIKPDEIKKELAGEFLGKVMDRMDDNISSGSTFTSSYISHSSQKKSNEDSDDDVSDENDFEESEFDEDFDDEEFFDENSFDEDEDV